MASSPRTPATLRVRAAARAVLVGCVGAVAGSGAAGEGRIRGEDPRPLVLVALSGGADSLALAAACAVEAQGCRVRVGAVVVDHGLQEGSAQVALRAAEQARGFGLDPVLVRRVAVGLKQLNSERAAGGERNRSVARTFCGAGPEAAARSARYRALVAAAHECGAGLVLTAHTRDDQAEQVLLALARGSGTRSIAGIPLARVLAPGVSVARPLLAEQFGVTRDVTEASCVELALEPWCDPHNADPAYARVRARSTVLPLLERELGSGFAAALARSADLAREDADALDALAEAHFTEVAEVRRGCAGGVESASGADSGGEGYLVALPVEALRALPSALSGRVIRLAAQRSFGAQLTREHTRQIASLVTEWRGQGPIHAPRTVVSREAGKLVFRRR